MTHPDADKWNEKYRSESEIWLQMEPRQLLTTFSHLLPGRGCALDAACGVGINTIFLAQQGLRTFGIDISAYALHLAKKRAHELGLTLELIVADLSNPWLPEDYFEVITNFHFLERSTFPVYQQALKTGGLIFFDAFIALENTVNAPEYYLAPGELEHAFQNFEIIHYAEHELEASCSHGQRGAAQLVARKSAVLQ
jgi:SAM-dependent methyltransferase